MAASQRPAVGLGVKLNHELKVTEIVRGGPCDLRDNSVLVDDVLTHINEILVQGQQPLQITHLTSGAPNSSVKLTFLRRSEVRTVEVRRNILNVPNLGDRIQKQVDLGFKRRNLDEIKEVFHRYAVEGANSSKIIPKDQLVYALKEFDPDEEITNYDKKEVESLLKNLDRNGDGEIDYEEFVCAVQAPTTLVHWTRSFPLHELLADAIPHVVGDEPLRAVSNLTPSEIDFVAEKFRAGLKRILDEKVVELRQMSEHIRKRQENYSADKFESGGRKMNCGNIDDFHKGITERIGNTTVDFLAAMKLEHCSKSQIEFKTTNLGITTTPYKEWMYITGELPVPEHQRMRNREIPSIEALVKCDMAIQAKLTKAEVISLLLYTGPMYHVFNTILRQSPEATYKAFKDDDNLFPCTIFLITSALQKLSRVTTLQSGMVLYRGLKGDVDLPDLFFKCDRHGRSGFTEWGFMSTTTKLDVALSYAGAGQDMTLLPRVLQIRVGSVDRGASIRCFSQYKDEDEYLYVPCSFVEKTAEITHRVCKIDRTADGGDSGAAGAGSGGGGEAAEMALVEMVPVAVNSNMKLPTVEELVQRKRDMHISAFLHHIHQVEAKLLELVSGKEAVQQRLAADKSAADSDMTVRGFVERIVSQCKEVLSRHQSVSCEEYVNDRLFRSLNIEMIETATNAMTKFHEWLENRSGSHIRSRWNVPLISAQRRWRSHLYHEYLIAEEEFKQKAALGEAEETAAAMRKKRDAAEKLCQAVGLIVDSVGEANALQETRLMSAASEGLNERFLRLLVAAGAEVDEAREDGVTALWLAAENGHDHCVQALVEMGASVNKAANDGTTPLSVAAGNGVWECVTTLIGLKADINLADVRKRTPVHQAALHGYSRTLSVLCKYGADINAVDARGFTPFHIAKEGQHDECLKIIKELGGIDTGKPKGRLFEGKKRLIISTGDIADIDGFFALAEYAKQEADVIFVMNYPAYIGVAEADENYAEKNPGLGYKYTAKQVLDSAPHDAPPAYRSLIERYTDKNDNERMKSAMTDLAFAIAHNVWNEVGEHGQLLFYIGGVNAINPFSSKAVKNEVLVYAEHVTVSHELPPIHGVLYDHAGQQTDVEWEKYEEIYMDFNGSLAFWNDNLTSKLSEPSVVKKIKGVIVMGGVYADVIPLTMPSIPNMLNRFSSATMNQLYHPQKAADFFAFLHQFQIPVFTVTNNVVGSIATFEDEAQQLATMVGVEDFMQANGLTGSNLSRLAKAHYASRYKQPKKPFDYYSAHAMSKLIQQSRRRNTHTQRSGNNVTLRHLFISNVYGTTFVSKHSTWEETRAAYASVVETAIASCKSDPELATKAVYFQKEIDIMASIHYLASVRVQDLSFELDERTKKLKLTSNIM